MFEMRIENLCNQVVMDYLVGQGNENRALYLHFNAELLAYGKHKVHQTRDEKFRQVRGVHLLYHCFPGSRTINVFSSVSENPFEKINGIKAWKHEVSHDSCWKVLSIFTDLFFEMADMLNNELNKKGFPDAAPRDMHSSISFDVFSRSLFQWVPVEVNKDSTDENGYRKIIKVLV